MSAGDLNWDQLAEAVVEAFNERPHLVEMLLDPLLPEADKQPSGVATNNSTGSACAPSAATCSAIGNGGPRGLLFYRPRPTARRVHDPACTPSCWS